MIAISQAILHFCLKKMFDTNLHVHVVRLQLNDFLYLCKVYLYTISLFYPLVDVFVNSSKLKLGNHGLAVPLTFSGISVALVVTVCWRFPR